MQSASFAGVVMRDKLESMVWFGLCGDFRCRIVDARRSTDHEVVPNTQAHTVTARRPAYLHSLALHQAEDILDQDSP